MTSNSFLSSKNNGLSSIAYIGDGSVLLAFDLDEDKITNLAGFSIKCTTPSNGPYQSNTYFLQNFLSLKDGLTSDKPLASSQSQGSDKSPFQSFHWVHFPSAGPGTYKYQIYAAYFQNDGSVQLGPSVTLNIDLEYKSFPSLEVGFTRGYVSSQAYEDRFKNAEIRPSAKSIDFDTAPYIKQYQWLGAHSRKLVFDFLAECQKDPSIFVDVFAFDFDEPDIVRGLCSLGSRVRVFQDDASLHTGPIALEPKAIDLLTNAGASVKTGHFNRFAHNKVMIQKKNNVATKVLTGSANFSIRGLYVQANSVLVFDDSDIARFYEQAFEQAFNDEKGFKSSNMSSKWFDVAKENLPPMSVSFAPHKIAFSLDKVSQAIENAKSSVFFAIMQMSGGGNVISDLKNIGSRNGLFSLGTIQAENQLQLFKPGADAAFTSFNFLSSSIPEPFKGEWSGGAGQVIHHKFVVCDFNAKNPVVFCGSSNLAAGGETSNGDNLIAIYDQKIATLYAIEAVRLFDHYKFRSKHEQSTYNKPFMLDSTDNWVRPYYDKKNIKFSERQLFSLPLQ